MIRIASGSLVRLAAGCRLSEGDQKAILLIPEGALLLKGSARAIIECCDGTRTVAEIVEELRRRYGSTDAERIASETLALLERLYEKGALECR